MWILLFSKLFKPGKKEKENVQRKSRKLNNLSFAEFPTNKVPNGFILYQKKYIEILSTIKNDADFTIVQFILANMV